MKRIILFILISSLLAACAPTPAATSQATALLVQNPPVSEPEECIETHTVETAPSPAPTAAPTDPPKPADSAAPSDAPAPVPSPSPVTSISRTNVGTSETLADPLPIEITTREFDWSKANPSGDYETRFRKETVDCSGLCLSLESLEANESHTRLKLRVQFPGDWPLLVCQNMSESFLNVRVLLDGEQVPFRMCAKSVQPGFDTASERCDDYEIVLESDAINVHTLAAYQALTLAPYVLCYDLTANGNRWRKDADGSDVFLSFRNGFSAPFHPAALPERAVSIDLSSLCTGIEPQTLPKRAPILRTVTLADLDVPRLLEEGYYSPDRKDGVEMPEWGVMKNETLDFSELEITVDRFEVNDLSVFAIIRVQYPDSWPGKLKWMLSDGDKLNFRLYVDGEDYFRNSFQKTGYRMGMSLYTERRRTPSSVEDWESYDVHEEYYSIRANRTFADGLLNAKEICFVPIVRHDKIYRINGKKWDLDREQTPYGDTWKYDIVEWEKEPIYEVAAYVDPASLIVSKECN